MTTSWSWPLPTPCSQYNDTFEANMTSYCPDNKFRALADEGLTTGFSKSNSSGGIISLKTLHAYENFISCGTSFLTFLVGGPCNMLCCLVFHRQGLKDRVNVCLFSLALVDLCCNIVWFLIGSYCLVSWLPFRHISIWWWKWVTLRYIRGLHRGFLSCSRMLTMLIAVERCISVVLPLKASKIVSTRIMTTLIIFIVVTLQIVCLIYPTKFHVVVVYDNKTGKQKITLPRTQFYEDNEQLVNYLQNYIIRSSIPILTFIVITISTVITVIKLRKLMPGRKLTSSSTTRSQIRLIKMLVVLTIVYIVANVPTIVVVILRKLIPGYRFKGRYRNIFIVSYISYLQLAMVPTTVSFFVYVTRSARFRSHLLHFLPYCCSEIIHKGHSTDVVSCHETTAIRSAQPSNMTLEGVVVEGKSTETAFERLSNYTESAPSLSSAKSPPQQKPSSQEGTDKKGKEQSIQNCKGDECNMSDLSVTFLARLPGTFHVSSASKKEGGIGESVDPPFLSKSKPLDSLAHVEKPSHFESLDTKTEKGLKKDKKPRNTNSESSKKGEPLKKEDTVTDTTNDALPNKEGTISTNFQVTHVEQQAENAAHPSKAGTVTTDVKVASVEQQAENAAHSSKGGAVTTDVVTHVQQQSTSCSSSDEHRYEELLPKDIGTKCTTH